MGLATRLLGAGNESSLWRFGKRSLQWSVCLSSLWFAIEPLAAQDAKPKPEAEATAKPDAKPEEKPPLDPLTPEAQAVADQLLKTLPEDSEARLMLDDILAGSQLGSQDGWFKVAVSQTRHTWERTAAKYDKNGDGKIERDEFTGSDAEFLRVDRTRDRQVTIDDFDWKIDPKKPPVPGVLLFVQSDLDGNGQLTAEEFLELFKQLDSGNSGFLSVDDLRDKFLPPPQDGPPPERPDKPSRSTLVLGLSRQEIGSLQPGPKVGEPAPDFTLKSLEGGEVTLSREIGEKPIVLVFGNFTCGPWRTQSGNVQKLYERHREQAKFFTVYVREAHPNDGWWMMQNRRVGVDLSQPLSDEQRRTIAGQCRDHLKLEIPFLVDTVKDTVGATYSGMPSRLYLIDREGKIAFKSGRGPFGFRVAEFEQALTLHLLESAKAEASDKSK